MDSDNSQIQRSGSNSSSRNELLSSSPRIVLYSYWQSSCSWRVRFALKLKGLSFEYKSVNLAKGENLTPEFKKLNPLGYVPVLIDGSLVVSDSIAIILCLEEKYPVTTPLLPADPKMKAVNMQTASIVSSSIQPLHMLGTLKWIESKCGNEESQTFARSNIEKGFHSLEKLVKEYSGRYATGEQLYMADVFLAPQIAVAMNRFRFNVDMSKYPTLERIFQAYKCVQEFEDSSPEKQPDAEQ